MYLEVFVKEARIESVNVLVLFRPDNIIKCTEERKPITWPVNGLHGKIWSQTNICRLIFIHKLVAQFLRSHMLCSSPAATEAIYCNFTLLWGHRLHAYAFMFVWVRTVLGSKKKNSCLPVFFFPPLFPDLIKNEWDLYLFWGNSLCLSTVVLKWMRCVCVCVCVSECLYVWLGSSWAGGGEEGSGCEVTTGLNQSTFRSARVQHHRG